MWAAFRWVWLQLPWVDRIIMIVWGKAAKHKCDYWWVWILSAEWDGLFLVTRDRELQKGVYYQERNPAASVQRREWPGMPVIPLPFSVCSDISAMLRHCSPPTTMITITTILPATSGLTPNAIIQLSKISAGTYKVIHIYYQPTNKGSFNAICLPSFSLSISHSLEFSLPYVLIAKFLLILYYMPLSTF